VTRREAWGGLRLWLALREPAAGDLIARSTSVPVLVGDGALAALVPLVPPETTGVRSYGPGGDDLAARLLAQVDAWIAAGRPSSVGLRIRAYPAGTDLPSPTIDRPHTRFVLDQG
jgi:hypothetical protein